MEYVKLMHNEDELPPRPKDGKSGCAWWREYVYLTKFKKILLV